jgi:hypothetical protein
MTRADARAILAALPDEVREACAAYVEESHPWLAPSFDPSPGSQCDITRALEVVADSIRRLPSSGEWEPTPDGGLAMRY